MIDIFDNFLQYKNSNMKKILATGLFSLALLSCGFAQSDKSKRPSPPAQNSFVLKSDAKIVIDYSQPAVKGRTIGSDIAPYGKVWRTGANEATTFEISKDILVEGQPLKAGKYSVYSIPGENEWTIIFNKKTGQWGTQYSEADDALRVKVKPTKNANFVERMSFTMDVDKILLNWGNVSVPVKVK
jgi:hypothetical protein